MNLLKKVFDRMDLQCSFLCGLISLMLLIRMPIFFMVGSSASFFSLGSAISPLAGYFGGVIGVVLYTILRFIWRLFFYSSFNDIFSISFLVHILPGWCATAYWVLPSIVGSVLLPLGAIFLFIVHPIGSQAYVYALLWCIPILLQFLQYKKVTFADSFFVQALCATFAAHAVGSVLWLYGMPAMQPHTWIWLTPVALAERIFFAASMSIARSVIVSILALPYVRRMRAQAIG
ncbi:MAG TPA: hypothetical protein VL201_03135 [Patescibacteria group bacterium]|jgi:hypothetical protein|nr:hypothetical protein [Patescibacteria group bacterium]